MTKLLPLLLAYGCAQLSTKPPPKDHVSVSAALDHVHASYLKGCVDAHKELKKAPSFPMCVERARAHRLELQRFMDYNEEK